MDKNKVKYNLKNVHWSKLTEGEDGTVTYGTPKKWPGAVSMSMEAQGEISKFHADGIIYYTAASNNGYNGDVEAALVLDDFRTEIMGEELDGKNVMIERADAKMSPFALLFEFDGDQHPIRHVLYNCSATRPAVESKTKEDTIEPVTEKLSISATPLADGRVKAKTSEETDKAAYDSWYTAVYEPTAVTPAASKSATTTKAE